MKTIKRYIFLILAVLFVCPAAIKAQDANPEGVVLNKYVVKGDDPYTYKINLEAFVTGETTTTTKRDNLDVVLVLDYSDSMSGAKAANLQTAVKSFIDQLADYAGNQDGVVQLAVIPFARYAYDLFNIRKNSKGKPEGVNYDWGTKDDGVTLKIEENFASINSFKSVTKSNKETIKSLIVAPNSDAFNNNIMHNGGDNGTSFIDNGTMLGVHTIQKTTRDSKKYIIIFTDGAPNDGDQAQGAIDMAYLVKKNGFAEIYTVGLNADSEISDAGNMKASDFLSYLSSNYPNAQMDDSYEMRGTSTKASDKYFTAAGNASGLTGIFEAIGEEISGGANAEGLTAETTTVIDVVSSDFKLPDGADGSNITLQVAACTGENKTYISDLDRYTFGPAVAVSDTEKFKGIQAKVGTFDAATKKFTEQAGGQTVQVSGFDFSENYVGVDKHDGKETPHGYKLIFSFVVEIDKDCPGGANVSTNTDASGIYVDIDKDGKPDQYGKFEVPVAKIPNMVIVRYGLLKGESATYKIYAIGKGGKSHYLDVVLTQTSDDPTTPCVSCVKINKPGRFEVAETNWSWAYTDRKRDGTYAKDDADKDTTPDTAWNEMGYGDPAQGYQAEIPTVFGTEVPDASHSIIRNLNDFTEDTFTCGTQSYLGTQYIFRATANKDVPSHGENEHNNVFYTIKPSK